MITTPNPYSGYRYPAEIISPAVWLYFRFASSFRDVEEILAARGIVITYEAVRQWCLKFGQEYTNKKRHRQGNLGDTWFLDEVFITIDGERYYFWRAVDQDGDVLDIFVQKHRDKRADKCFFRKLLKGMRYAPRVIVTFPKKKLQLAFTIQSLFAAFAKISLVIGLITLNNSYKTNH